MQFYGRSDRAGVLQDGSFARIACDYECRVIGPQRARRAQRECVDVVYVRCAARRGHKRDERAVGRNVAMNVFEAAWQSEVHHSARLSIISKVSSIYAMREHDSVVSHSFGAS